MPKSKTRRKGAVRPAKLSPVLALVICLIAAFLALRDPGSQAALPVSMDDIPAYSGEAYVEINGGEPFFTESDWTTDAFETYSELDELGRCGVAYANICQEIMPTEPRGKIGSVKPSGWHTIRYNGLVEGNYLYNRCHLIGYQLAGENANPKNLITARATSTRPECSRSRTRSTTMWTKRTITSSTASRRSLRATISSPPAS